jgi:hypothetical protein
MTMPENWWAYPEGHPMHLPGYGGPAEVARMLTHLGYGRDSKTNVVTRQAVYSLWKHRHGNGFPDRERVDVVGGWRQLFDLDKVKGWAQERMDAGQEPEEKEPWER